LFTGDYIVVGKLCATTKISYVTNTLIFARDCSGLYRILLENLDLPGDLERKRGGFVACLKHLH